MSTLSKFIVRAASASWLGAAALAQAAPVGAPHLSASTALGQYGGFSINQMVDGITADSPFNGYASGIGATTGRITLTLDALYELDGFSLWNDINILNEGVRSFRLSFEDDAGTVLSSTGVFNAVSMFAAQVYSFSPVSGVRRVQLDVLGSNLQIEIREVAFNGQPMASGSVPEPGSAALALMGLAVAGAGMRWRRR